MIPKTLENNIEISELIKNYKIAKYNNNVELMDAYMSVIHEVCSERIRNKSWPVFFMVHILFDWLEASIVKGNYMRVKKLINEILFYYKKYSFIDNSQANERQIPYFYDLLALVEEFFTRTEDEAGLNSWLEEQLKWVDPFAKGELIRFKKQHLKFCENPL